MTGPNGQIVVATARLVPTPWTREDAGALLGAAAPAERPRRPARRRRARARDATTDAAEQRASVDVPDALERIGMTAVCEVPGPRHALRTYRIARADASAGSRAR